MWFRGALLHYKMRYAARWHTLKKTPGQDEVGLLLRATSVVRTSAQPPRFIYLPARACWRRPMARTSRFSTRERERWEGARRGGEPPTDSGDSGDSGGGATLFPSSFRERLAPLGVLKHVEGEWRIRDSGFGFMAPLETSVAETLGQMARGALRRLGCCHYATDASLHHDHRPRL